MSDQFLAEIRMFAGTFAPKGWALCNGQQLPIQQNQALFSLIGTFYGGNGITTFGLPDLGATTPIGFQTGDGLTPYQLADRGGAPTVTLTDANLASHAHQALGAPTRGNTTVPANATWAQAMLGRVKDGTYAAAPDSTVMAPDALVTAGNGQPHDNLPPYLTVSFIIALVGVFPSRD